MIETLEGFDINRYCLKTKGEMTDTASQRPIEHILEPIAGHDPELLRRVSGRLKEAPILAKDSIEYAVGEMLHRAIKYLIDEGME